MSICTQWVNVKRLYDDVELPAYATEHAAGMDLVAHETVTIKPGERALVSTGIALEIPTGFFGGLYPRSGLASKHGIALANCVGVIDADYRGEVKAAIQNNSNKEFTINKGDRICQLIIQPYIQARLIDAKELGTTNRGEGGFGSTGIKMHSTK